MSSNTLPTVAVAESLTCGMLASRIGDFSGVSKWFKGGIVSYSNEAKIKILETDGKKTIRANGVSPEVAKQMAKGASKLLDADIGISTTGYAEKYYDNNNKQNIEPIAYIAVYNRMTDETNVYMMFDINLNRNPFRTAIVNMICDKFLSEHITLSPSLKGYKLTELFNDEKSDHCPIQ